MHMKDLVLRKAFVLVAISVASFTSLDAQVYSNLEAGKKHAKLKDSLKTAEYPYVLPILGKKATKAGFSLPYSAGIGVNYVWTKADVLMDNLQIGFNGGPMNNMDEIVRFDNVNTEISGINIRPDVWLLPFLNIYGIFAQSRPQTTIDCGIYIPDSDGNTTRILDIHAQTSTESTTAGFGITPTIGIGGGFAAFDLNFTWTDVPVLDDPAFAFVFGPRFGKSFNLKKPESSIAIWVGGFRLRLKSNTSGSIPLSDAIDTDGLQTRVDNAITQVGNAQTEVDNWWNGLTEIEQNNPVNIAKYGAANRALGAAGNFLSGMDNALNDDQFATVQYSLDKRPADMWNFIVGTQYQLNKHWMVRAEFGFLGSRQQFIGGLQYRFGL